MLSMKFLACLGPCSSINESFEIFCYVLKTFLNIIIIGTAMGKLLAEENMYNRSHVFFVATQIKLYSVQKTTKRQTQ